MLIPKFKYKLHISYSFKLKLSSKCFCFLFVDCQYFFYPNGFKLTKNLVLVTFYNFLMQIVNALCFFLINLQTQFDYKKILICFAYTLLKGKILLSYFRSALKIKKSIKLLISD